MSGMPPTLNPVLHDFWMTQARNRVLYGGRSSSKSWDAAGFAIFLAASCKVRFLCTRQFQNKITDSVYTLLKIQIERFGLKDDFEILNNTIIHKRTGSEFVFYGLWRHIDEIKSMEGIDICWIEEAHNLTEEQWKILEPTLRKDGSQFWVVFNPKFATDFTYKRFVLNPPPNTVKRQINFDENPFLTQTILDVIEAARLEDEDQFNHVYMGVPLDNDDEAIIKRAWVQAAINAHKNERIVIPEGHDWFGRVVGGYDVADDGKDLNATTFMNGSVGIHLDQWKGGEDELFQSTERYLSTAKLLGAHDLGYDSIGVGAGVGSNLNKLKWRQHFKYNAGAGVYQPDRKIPENPKVTNKEHFSNLKAQTWRNVSNRFKKTHQAQRDGLIVAPDEMISISSECDAKFLEVLCEELCTPRKDYDNQGREKVESKKDLKKREIESPNIADSFIIANSSYVKGSVGFFTQGIA